MSGPRLNPRLLEVPLYIAGRPIEEVKAELGLDHVVKLASNESPIGPSPMAVEAAMRSLAEAHRYPGNAERELRRKLAGILGPPIDEDCIVIGNGGTDILNLVAQAFVFDGGNTVMSSATFPMYRISTTTFGGTPRRVPARADYHHDLPAMAEQIDDDTRIVFLCSPNNPTGFILTRAEADDFMARVPDHVVVVFDESYHDYVTDPDYADSLSYVREGKNVFVARSFSKSSGLANMRVGYAVAPRELADYLRHALVPFHTGAIALAAAAASLDDTDYLQRNRQAVIEGREHLRARLMELGLDCLPSQANFMAVVDPPLGPQAFVEAVLRRGYIVRPMTGFGMPNAVRITVGSREENEEFIRAVEEVLSE